MYTPGNNMCPTISHTYSTDKYLGLHIISRQPPRKYPSRSVKCKVKTKQKYRQLTIIVEAPEVQELPQIDPGANADPLRMEKRLCL